MNNYLVIGDVMLDYYRKGFADRISPEAPVPIAINPTDVFSAGGAANVAINLMQDQSDTVTLVGLVGDDKYGRTLRRCVEEYNVNVDFKNQLKHTIIKERIICNDQQIIRIDRETPNFEFDLLETLQNNYKLQHQPNCVILSDYAKGCLSDIKSIIEHYNQMNIPVYVDPKGTDFYRYKNCFVLTPNEKEFRENTLYDPKIDLIQNMICIRRLLNINYLFVTRGSQGVYFVDTQDNISTVHARKVDVVDVTGAGDVFISNLARSMQVTGDTFASACTAVDIATRSVTIRGTKIQLATCATPDRTKRKVTVFTNGCFDLLHAGHVDYLTKAKALGKYLIVGLNSDVSVSRIKGRHRPIISQSERKVILEALSVVDEVILFDDLTPQDLIEKLKPDVLVKGGDYKIDEIAGSDFVHSYGGKVVTIPILYRQSTTQITNMISERPKLDKS